MEVSVLIEPIEGGRFRGLAGEPFGCCAEGNSPEEVARSVERLIAARLRGGGRIITLSIGSSGPPIPSPTAPISAEEAALDTWFWQAMQEGIDEYRRKDEEALKQQEDAAAHESISS